MHTHTHKKPQQANKHFPAEVGNAPYILSSKFSCLFCCPLYFVSYLSIIHSSSLILHLAAVCVAWHPPTQDTARLCSLPSVKSRGVGGDAGCITC